MLPFITPGLLGGAPATPPAAIWNSATGGGRYTFTSTDHIATYNNAAGYIPVVSSTSKTSGKWYSEVLIGGTVADVEVGFAATGYDTTHFLGFNATGWGWDSAGGIYNNNASVQPGDTFATGDTIMLAIDATTGKMWWGKNGTWTNSGNPGAGTGQSYTGTGGSTFYIAGSPTGGTSTSLRLNSTLTYSTPSGFSNW